MDPASVFQRVVSAIHWITRQLLVAFFRWIRSLSPGNRLLVRQLYLSLNIWTQACRTIQIDDFVWGKSHVLILSYSQPWIKVDLIFRLQFVSNFGKKRNSRLNKKPRAIFGRHGSFCCSPSVTCSPILACVRAFCVHFRCSQKIRDSPWSVQNFTFCVHVCFVLFFFLSVCLFFAVLYLFVFSLSLVQLEVVLPLSFKWYQETQPGCNSEFCRMSAQGTYSFYSV